MENKIPFDYANSNNSNFGFDQKRVKSKQRDDLNRTYIGISDTRRYQSSKREEGRDLSSTQYVGSMKTRKPTTNNTGKRIDVESYSDPNSNISNSNILNVVSPDQKLGFHITDLLEKPKTTKPVRTMKNEQGRIIMPEIVNTTENKPITAMPFSNILHNEDRYMIKNFRLVNLNDISSKNSERNDKPITAAPLAYNDSRSRVIKRMTGQNNRKNKLASTSTSFGKIKSPKRLPVSNSLLNQYNIGYDDKMQPINEHFEQMFEETHYMFPKQKTKFGVKALAQTSYSGFNKPKGQPRSNNFSVAEINAEDFKKKLMPQTILEDDEITAKLKNKASRFSTPKYKTKIMRQEPDLRKKVELDKLLHRSLTKRAKETKERSYELMLNKTITGRGDPNGGLTDQDQLNMIMNTWLFKEYPEEEYTYEKLQKEAKLTSHSILKVNSRKELYPDDLKDCEIEIYMRNRKIAPKYEMLQFIKFSNTEDKEDSSNKNNSEETKDDSADKENTQDPYDLKIGFTNPITNSRINLSFKLKVEFLDHVIPDFEIPEHLPHSLFDDCSTEIDKIMQYMEDKKRRNDFLWAYSPYIQENGEMVDCKVKVLEFDFDRGEFLVEFDDRYKQSEERGYDYLLTKDKSYITKLRKYCCRSNLQLEYETKYEADIRKEMIARSRKLAQNQLN